MEPLNKKLAVAAVAASLGLSLGVPVADALAADAAGSPPNTLSSDQMKSGIESRQGKFRTSIESKQGKFRSEQGKIDAVGSTQMKTNTR